MSDLNLKPIEKKLDAIIQLLSISFLEGKNQTDSIIFLGKLGLDKNTIAEMVGTRPATVGVRLSEAKNSKKPGGKDKKSEDSNK